MELVFLKIFLIISIIIIVYICVKKALSEEKRILINDNIDDKKVTLSSFIRLIFRINSARVSLSFFIHRIATYLFLVTLFIYPLLFLGILEVVYIEKTIFDILLWICGIGWLLLLSGTFSKKLVDYISRKFNNNVISFRRYKWNPFWIIFGVIIITITTLIAIFAKFNIFETILIVFVLSTFVIIVFNSGKTLLFVDRLKINSDVVVYYCDIIAASIEQVENGIIKQEGVVITIKDGNKYPVLLSNVEIFLEEIYKRCPILQDQV